MSVVVVIIVIIIIIITCCLFGERILLDHFCVNDGPVEQEGDEILPAYAE